MRPKISLVFLLSASIFFTACQSEQISSTVAQKSNKDSAALIAKQIEKKIVPTLPAFVYHFEPKSIWQQKDSFEGFQHQLLLAAINRVDESHLKRLDSILVPNIYIDTIAYYLPFPAYSAALAEVKKIILFSYPAEVFAAYEYGNLILTGPTNMGKKSSKTPTGLFFCNWKSKESISTVDDEWKLKWNFNVSNHGGVGFHQYELPGYPASHSCMRLWAQHAEFLYYWAEQWKLKEEQIEAKGTPVIIFGEYPFGQPRPWFALSKDPKALNINEAALQSIFAPFKDEIMEAQATRDSLYPALPDSSAMIQ